MTSLAPTTRVICVLQCSCYERFLLDMSRSIRLMKHGEDCADKVLEQWGWDDRKTGDSNPFYG